MRNRSKFLLGIIILLFVGIFLKKQNENTIVMRMLIIRDYESRYFELYDDGTLKYSSGQVYNRDAPLVIQKVRKLKNIDIEGTIVLTPEEVLEIQRNLNDISQLNIRPFKSGFTSLTFVSLEYDGEIYEIEFHPDGEQGKPVGAQELKDFAIMFLNYTDMERP